MTDGPIKLAAAGIGTILVVLGLLSMVGRGCEKVVDTQVRIADEAKGEARGHVSEAEAKDKIIAAAKADLDLAKREKDNALARLAQLQKRVRREDVPPSATAPAESGPGPHTHLEPVEPGPSAVVAETSQVIRAQAEALEAYRIYTTKLEGQIDTLTGARNHWKAAFEAEERRAAALELALKAQKSAASSASWKSGIKGGLVGIAVGYLGGRYASH